MLITMTALLPPPSVNGTFWFAFACFAISQHTQPAAFLSTPLSRCRPALLF